MPFPVVKISFPRYANYNSALRYMTEHAFHDTVRYIMPPNITRRTEELGARYSPDYVCTPFKTLLGSMIEALEAGANTLMMTHGFCRLGYYGELQEQILRDLGYEFSFINLSEYSTGKKKDWIKVLKRIDPKVSIPKFILAFRETAKMVEYLDEITGEYYRNCGFDPSGAYEKAYRRFLNSLYLVRDKTEIEDAYRQVKNEFHEIPLDKPQYPLRVGIVGEFFTAMDPFANLEVEQKLANMGVEVHRWMNMTNHLFHYFDRVKNLSVKIQDLCEYEMGPTSTANIWYARTCAEHRFDGIIHIKSAGCTPEIDIMPVLQRIGEDYKIPVLYLTYDSQTSDVGLMTRLEAFYDMIAMRKKVI